MIIRLNGIPISSAVDGLKKAMISETRKNSDGYTGRKFSSNLTFYGQGYEIIKQELIDDPLGVGKTVDFEVLDDCCGQTPTVVFDGEIRGDGIDWCEGECVVRADAIEKKPAADCVKNTIIWDNRNGFQQREHPKFSYCIELRPQFFMYFHLYSYIVTRIGFIPLQGLVFGFGLLVKAFKVVLKVLTLGKLDINVPEINARFNEFVNRVDENAIGCGRKHPSPLVRDYIQNVCDICGLNFVSPIFNDPQSDFYNSAYLFAPVEKGRRRNIVTNFIEENRPNLNLKLFLDPIADLFNADYIISKSDLTFDAKDQINNVQWTDYNTIKSEGRIVKELCYEYSGDDRPSYVNFQYSDDPFDKVGNEARERYNDIVEWNNPYTSTQSGSLEKTFFFGTSRFRNDGLDDDVLTHFQNFPFIGREVRLYDTSILLSHGTCNMPKLIVWDGKSKDDARVQTYNRPGYSVPHKQNYNFPYHFTEYGTVPNTAYHPSTPNLSIYGKYWAIANPKANSRVREFSVTFRYTCDEIADFDINKTFGTPYGNGIIDEVDIDYDKREITISGKV